MEENVEVTNEHMLDPKHQLAKLLLCTAAGFIAGKVVESAYNSVMDRRSNPSIEVAE